MCGRLGIKLKAFVELHGVAECGCAQPTQFPRGSSVGSMLSMSERSHGSHAPCSSALAAMSTRI